MSAPPIAAVVVYPFRKLNKVLAPKNDAATAGVLGSELKKPAIVATLAVKRPVLIKCLPGKFKARLDILAANFKKATIEPVNVIPPTSRVKMGQGIINCLTYQSRLRGKQ
jgi:hypothetical protein